MKSSRNKKEPNNNGVISWLEVEKIGIIRADLPIWTIKDKELSTIGLCEAEHIMPNIWKK